MASKTKFCQNPARSSVAAPAILKDSWERNTMAREKISMTLVGKETQNHADENCGTVTFLFLFGPWLQYNRRNGEIPHNECKRNHKHF